MAVTDGSHVHAEELELGAHVGAFEAAVTGVGDHVGGDARHGITGGDETVYEVVVGGALADGEDGGIGGSAFGVDDDSSALADFQAAIPGDFVPGSNADGEDDDIGLQFGVVVELQLVAGVFPFGDELGVLGGMDLYAELFDFGPQEAARVLVYLHAHEVGGKLHDMGFQSEIFKGIGAFEAE